MCFTTLPPELQEGIIIDLEKPDLYSLCLVSKSLLHLARPLLYRSVELHLTSLGESQEQERMTLGIGTLEVDDEEYVEDFEWAKVKYEKLKHRQVVFFNTLKANQCYKTFVEEVVVNLSECFHAAEYRVEVGEVLSSCSNLRSFRIKLSSEANMGLDANRADFFVQNTPLTVRSLDLADAGMPPSAALRLLDRLPLLESLALGDQGVSNIAALLGFGGHSTPTAEAVVPPLPHLQSLTLWKPYRDPSFLSTITSSSPNLTTIRTSYVSIPALLPQNLSHLKNLTIFGELVPWEEHLATETQNIAFDIIRLLKQCQTLQYLDLSTYGWQNDRHRIDQLESLGVLHNLPSSLKTLVLSKLFSSEYLLHFLSTSDISLHQLELARFKQTGKGGGGYDEEGENEIEATCKNLNIPVIWIGGRM